jgi:hypothetical protein
MSDLVYTTHPVVDSYARENITYECVNVMGQRQGRHNILWFALECMAVAEKIYSNNNALHSI